MFDCKIIGLLGDSIANGYWDEEKGGWFNRLILHLKNEAPHGYTFCNMAKGGDTSIDVCQRLTAEAAGREIDLLMIAVGVNDLVCTSAGEKMISPLLREMTWEKILQRAGKFFDAVAIIGLLPVLEGQIGDYDAYIYNKDIEAYNADLEKWCCARAFDFYSPYDDCCHWSREMYDDNIHPNARGHEELERLIYNHLKIRGLLA